MTRVPTSPPAPALRDFLDEVVVPLLVERFLRERAAADPGRDLEHGDVSQTKDFVTVRTGSPQR